MSTAIYSTTLPQATINSTGAMREWVLRASGGGGDTAGGDWDFSGVAAVGGGDW